MAGVAVRLLLDARASDGAVLPPGILVLGSVGAGAMGLAFTPFALAGALPTALGVVIFVVVVVTLAGSLGAWALLRRLA